MPYASLRNAIPRKTNKERSQPAARKKYVRPSIPPHPTPPQPNPPTQPTETQGLLEKHKDYVQRAQDYHKKTKAINNLRQKAAFRNPDEFYFAMTKSKTKGG